MKVRKVTKEQILKAIQGTGGIIEPMLQKLGISRQAYWKWENKHPELKQARYDEREKQVDISEEQLFKANKNGEKWAVNKILSTLGKDRGYVERQETHHTGVMDFNLDLAERLKRAKELEKEKHINK